MSDKLKSCPFCGHTPEPSNYIDSIHPVNREKTVYQAGCLATEGGCDAFVLADSYDDAIKAWNTRAENNENIHKAQPDTE